MNAEIIYEKKYPAHEILEERAASEPAVPPTKPLVSLEQILQALKNTTYIPIPERIAASKKFIQTVIEVTEFCEMDTKIVRHDGQITATISFDCGGSMRDIRRIFAMVDEFAFFRNIDGHDITISMDFYTHQIIRNGRIVSLDPNLPE